MLHRATLAEVCTELAEALRLYVELDNDTRAGCEIKPEDWAKCHQPARAALVLYKSLAK